MSTQPSPTRCPHCGTTAAELICHLCKQPRPEYARLIHPHRGDAQLQFIIAVLLVVGIIVAALLIDHNVRGQSAPLLSHLARRLDDCALPQQGDVLLIAVTTRDLNAQDIAITCVHAGPSPSWSRM